ncbi:MAG: hypothetical protein HY905_18865 [Deltaproteobacteria bacterium]|nr:hypothetical protein [Deltaproteobacteria bacterium]
MNATRTMLGLALLVTVAGCTASNPFYDGGEEDVDDGGTDGIVPDEGTDDVGDRVEVRDDGADPGEIPPGEADGTTEADVPVETTDEDAEGLDGADADAEADALLCGNGTIDPGEQCDDGGGNSDTVPDACRTDCTDAHCGDGVVDAGETCDAGGANSDIAPDACRTSCLPASCGDGVVDTGETCDAGGANSDIAPDACRTSCLPASCGDGVVDSAEECDDASGFCATCALAPPTGWVECADALGNPAVFLVTDWPGNHDAIDWRDHCQSLIDALSPVGYAFEGLGAFYDQNLWDCVSPSLVGGTNYYEGLTQDPASSDYAEPAGGWYWNAWNGTAWTNVAPYDAANTWMGEAFDDGGGTGGDAECTRLTGGPGTWTASDYSCTTNNNWSGICMIRY